tara:strand:- start:856 stop:1488 length:633 start_codon:yes stop_codon:yes gene_type:complete
MNLAVAPKSLANSSGIPSTTITTAFVAMLSSTAIAHPEIVASDHDFLDFAKSYEIFRDSQSMAGLPTLHWPISDLDTVIENASSLSLKIEETTLQEWTEKSLSRLENLAALKEEWAGTGFDAASAQAIADAERFILKLNHLGVKIPPAIGLDDDGSISLHFSANKMTADLSIHKDGTYSYFAEVGEQTAYSDESKVNGNIDGKLIEILLA